jgi:glycosyltransferase involved in cell wall biosynthesis
LENLEMPKNTHSISVIIPAYNQADYLSQAIQSVLGQTNPNVELVVVNDGSTDETPQILSKFQDPRIRVISQPNRGLAAARNTGLRESSAPLIALLDSDDYFLPDKLAIQSEYLLQHPEIGMVGGGIQIVNHAGEILKQIINKPDGLDLQGLLFANPFVPSSIMIRRQWFGRVGTFDENLRACEDWDMWLRIGYAGCLFAWVDYPVIAYRQHQGQMTREPERMRKAIFTVLDKFFQQPDIPENIYNLKDEVYAIGYLHSAAYAYHANQFSNGQNYIREAFHYCPPLRDQHYKRVVDIFAGWSEDPRTAEPADFLQRVIAYPPLGHPGLRRQLRRAMADVLLEPVFLCARQNRREYRWDLLKVILNKPDWLLNRGVLRVLMDAWLPAQNNSSEMSV